jgi:hypothetical protein
MFIISSVERHYIHNHELYIILPHFIVTLWQSVSYVAQAFVCFEYEPDTIQSVVDHLYCARRISVISFIAYTHSQHFRKPDGLNRIAWVRRTLVLLFIPLCRDSKFKYQIYLVIHLIIQSLTTGRKIPSGTNNPPAEVSTQWY